jgi:GAF domain-containing protein
MLTGVLGFLLRAFLPAVSLSFAVGILLIGYNVMSRQLLNPLRALTEYLEAVVAQRNGELQHGKDTLQHLKEGQRRVSQISQEIAQIADPTAIVTRLTALIHAYLGYHHVYVYQPDKSGQYLVASAAAGTTARSVMRRGHRLEIGAHSLVGRAAAEHRPQIAQARGEDAIFFEDTALPGARAEIALPLLIGDQLLGVLDLQSIHFEAFSDQDLIVMTSLADHAAVTLDNARLRQEIHVTLAESDELQRQYLRQAWGAFKDRSESLPAYIYADTVGVKKTSLTTACTPEISHAAIQGELLVNNSENDSSSVVLPIALRGQVIGALQVYHKTGRSWQPEDIATLTEITERLGLALETARLSQENRRRAVREQLISEITAHMHETLDVDTVLHTAAREMGMALGLHDVTIRLEMDKKGNT